jgi:predicted transcriptional regulator
MADVLKTAGEGARKTRIMRTANLSYGLLRKYLDEALAIGYLTFNGEGYGVTEDGEAFLKKCSEYSCRYSKVGRELESMRVEKEELTRMCMNRKFELKSSANKGQRVQATDLARALFSILLGNCSCPCVDRPLRM